jgi:hypothetical protein
MRARSAPFCRISERISVVDLASVVSLVPPDTKATAQAKTTTITGAGLRLAVAAA